VDSGLSPGRRCGGRTGNARIPCRIGPDDVPPTAPTPQIEERPMRYLMTTKESSRAADEALFADMGAFI
jgi:hypothetical protein